MQPFIVPRPFSGSGCGGDADALAGAFYQNLARGDPVSAMLVTDRVTVELVGIDTQGVIRALPEMGGLNAKSPLLQRAFSDPYSAYCQSPYHPVTVPARRDERMAAPSELLDDHLA